MTWQTELSSWLSPPSVSTAETPTVGQKAPPTPKLNIPAKDGKPTIISFLRHCGCPFAEKTFLNMRDMAVAHKDVDWVAVSHSEQGATERWLAALPEPAKNTQPNLHVIVDAEREVHCVHTRSYTRPYTDPLHFRHMAHGAWAYRPCGMFSVVYPGRRNSNKRASASELQRAAAGGRRRVILG